jgi:sterol desaturase/sphingolipid hydroxylase (fatty acid hydroxylase superfamily)
MTVPASVTEFRARHRAEHIGPRYRGWLHLSITTSGAATAVAIATWQVDNPGAIELAMVPIFFLVANLVEYFGHRGPMHHRRRGLALLFERHSQQHHRYFTHDAMEVESPRDFQMVLFPPLMLGFFLGGVAPIGLALAALTTANVGWLFAATGFGYFLLYEWLHFAYHQPSQSWIGRNALVAHLRRHHLVHHDLRRMTSVNFNVTFPIADRLFGTMANPQATTPASPGRRAHPLHVQSQRHES